MQTTIEADAASPGEVMREPPPPRPQTNSFAATTRNAGGAIVPEVFIPPGENERHMRAVRPDAPPEEKDVPVLEGGAKRITVSALFGRPGSPYPGSTACVIVAGAPPLQSIVPLLRGENGAWTPVALPAEAQTLPHFERFMAEAVNTGFVPLFSGKAQLYWAAMRNMAPSLLTLGITASGEVFTLAQRYTSGADFLAAPIVHDNIAVGRLEGEELQFFFVEKVLRDPRRQLVTLSLDEHNPSLVFRLPFHPQRRDSAAITPITDAYGYCHGAFVKAAGGEVILCGFKTKERPETIGRVTAAEGRPGPRRAREIQASLASDGNTDIYVVEDDGSAGDSGRIWHAVWEATAVSSGNDLNLFWRDTGHRGNGLATTYRTTKTRYVFADGTPGASGKKFALLSEVRLGVWERTEGGMPPLG
jgi:hypothetical protein